MAFEVRNRVLASLRPAAQDFITNRMITREISTGELIYDDGARFTHAIFPHEGVISMLACMDNGRCVEKTSIGLEGFIGFVHLMGGSGSIGRSVVQVPGYASWLSIADLDEALQDFVCVRETMLRYAKSLITQLMETVACNSLHSAEQRVIRWLLQAHDRVNGDAFSITQQAIADVLGLRRATVSEVCSLLQSDGLLSYTRGTMEVKDRDGLDARSCECYARIRGHSLLEQG